MDIISNIINFFRDIDKFSLGVLFAVLIIYNFFSLVLAFQIFSFNRLMVQETFAPVFKAIALVHAAVSFILLMLVVFSL